jgi:hypothetical protein
MRSSIILLLSLSLILFSGQSLYATSYHVYPGDDLAYTITQNTCSWDIVYIHEGVHTLKDDVNISGKSLPIVGDGSDKTIIILDDNRFNIYKTKNNLNPMIVTISGVTFKNAKISGGIIFENYIPNTSLNLVLSDCKFENIGDVALISATYPVRDYKVTINRCDIYYGESSGPEIGTSSTENVASNYNSIILEINNSNFSNSSSLTAYSFSPESLIDLKVENSVFFNNSTGIQVFGPVELYSKNNLFSNNLKGVLIDSVNSKSILINNTVDSNGYDYGFGIYNKGAVELQNNIISNNNYGIYNDGQIVQRKNILWKNKVNYGITDSDFIVSDPLFTIGPRGNYYLGEESKAIDSGSNTSSFFELNRKTTQVNEVFDKDIVDIGYHYPSNFKPSIFSRLIDILCKRCDI